LRQLKVTLEGARSVTVSVARVAMVARGRKTSNNRIEGKKIMSEGNGEAQWTTVLVEVCVCCTSVACTGRMMSAQVSETFARPSEVMTDDLPRFSPERPAK
jgi:hypothetical protein